LWLLFALAAARLTVNPRRDPLAGLALLAIRLYARFWHRLRVEGAEHIPRALHPGPLIVVCNHTCGADPLLVQAAVPFEVRWMMAEDMQVPALRGMWDWLRIIPVHRVQRSTGHPRGADARAARLALRHLRDGGVLGVFPEGAIERPAGMLLPFLPGIGFLVRHSRASVLPVVIAGTPQTQTAWGSLLKPSRAVVRFLPVVSYAEPPRDRMDAQQITDDLHARMAAALTELAAEIAHRKW
ncbi:MAG TPA: lysophospholipid acyltransferase family protein, partial [Phycisphaerales bacterium]|nr:lysophospholipid acyltransferase family protein [Phycisphaerales bacterium]